MLDALRNTHNQLDDASSETIRAITNLAATIEVLDEAGDDAIRTALESSRSTLATLATFLEAVAASLEGAGVEVDAGTLLGLLEELEPRPGEIGPDPRESAGTDGSDSDANPFDGATPLRRLSGPYSVLLNLERDLYANRTRRPFRIRKLKEIWGDLSRIGSSHPNEGLVARLMRLTDHVDAALRGDEPDGPWSREEIRAVRTLTERTESILEWSPDELRQIEREAWIRRVGDWVETVEDEPGSVGQLSEMLTRFLTDRPRAPSPEVVEILERISELEGLPKPLESQTAQALDEYG